MKIEKGEISSSQLMFLVIGLIQGSNLVMTYLYGITNHDTWLAVLVAFVISFPFVWIDIALAQKFSGKNLIQINDIIYGSYLGKLISTLYILFFLLLNALNIRYIGAFFTTYIMPETPIIAIIIMFTFVCAWAVRNGLEVIARSSFILVVITALLIIFDTVLLLKDMKLTNFLPIFDLSLKDFIQGTQLVVSIPFTQIVVFLMFIPFVNNIKQAKGSIVLGVIIGGISLLITVIRDIATLGIMANIMVSPTFEAVRLIEIAKILTRLDILVAIGLLVIMFLRVSIFYYATVLSIAQIFNLRSFVPLVFPIGIIIISLTMLLFDSSMEHTYSTSNFYPIYSFPFQILIPPISLFIAKIRGLPKKQGGECK